MQAETLLRAILPEILIDNFDIVRYEKSPERFDIWLDEKKVLLPEDRANFGRNLPFSPHSHLVLL